MPLRRLSAVVLVSTLLAIALAEMVHLDTRPSWGGPALCDSGGKRRCP